MARAIASRKRVPLFAKSDESAAETIALSKAEGMAYWRRRLSQQALSAGQTAYLQQMAMLKREAIEFGALQDSAVVQWCSVAVARLNRGISCS